MAYKVSNRNQQTFLPPVIDDYVGPQDPVRAYDAMVEAMDLAELGIVCEPKAGADEYYPKEMLKLCIYGYSYGNRSSRKLERACHHNLSFQWLMGGLKPDYSTIARFRDKHKKAIKKALKQCVQICMKLDLIEGNILFIDGSKFRANASIDKTYNRDQAANRIKKLEQKIDEIVDSSMSIDKQEERQQSFVKLKEQIHEKAKLIDKMKNVLRELENAPAEKCINTTDAGAVKAKSRQGSHASYNVQSTVDGKNGLIVNIEAVSQHDDSNQLSPQVEQAIETLGKEPKHVVADSRYSSIQDVKKIDSGINVVVPSLKQAQEQKDQHPIKPFDKKNFIYSADRDEYICPEGNPLAFRSLTPEQDKTYQAKGSGCRKCPHFGSSSEKCTRSINGRRITRLRDEELKEQMETNYLKPENQQLYKLRKENVEHPFGHMKRNLGIGQFLTRGKAKVDAESSIMAMCFNITRAITIMGVTELITRLQGT